MENAAAGTQLMAIPGGLTAGCLGVLLAGGFFGHSATFADGGDHSVISNSPGGGANPVANVYYRMTTAGDAANGGVNVNFSGTANAALVLFDVGTSVTAQTLSFDDGTVGSPQSAGGWTKGGSAKLELWAMLGPSGFAAMANTLGDPILLSPAKRLMFTDVDPASGYTNGTTESFVYSPNNYIFTFGLEII